MKLRPFWSILILLLSVTAHAGFFQYCEQILTSAWRVAFPVSRVIEVGGKNFHVYSSVVGSGGEGIVYRLFDEPGKKLKIFTPENEHAFSGEGRVDLARVGPLPQGYIERWVAKIESYRGLGLPVPQVFEVGRGYVVMEYIEGVTYKQLGRKNLGYSEQDVKDIRENYWNIIKFAESRGVSIDGADKFGNLIWDPARRRWFIIDP